MGHFQFQYQRLLNNATPVFRSYWEFAAKRQEIFFKRQESQAPPWTDDPILERHKFTNAYRAADRVSQYLIKNVIYTGDYSNEDVFFRVFLFKIFNKIETWESLVEQFGEVTYDEFSFSAVQKYLSAALLKKKKIFSGAYIMPSGVSSFGRKRKHENYLLLLERMMEDDVCYRVQECQHTKDVYKLLLSYPMIGPFLAYQLTTDINYSTIIDFPETEFVIAGPGAIDGVAKCFQHSVGLSPEEIIIFVTREQDYFFDLYEINFKSLWGRPLQLIDCQNLFCEISKYSRVAFPDVVGTNNRKKIKQLFKPTWKTIDYFFPPKWSLNELMQK